MKKESKLGIIVGLVLKGLIWPIKADCPTPKQYTDLQQNLNKTEYTENYGKESGFPNSSNIYYSKFFQY